MRLAMNHRARSIGTLGLLGLTVALSGCSRREYRLQADEEAYATIEEHNFDPRWEIQNYGIDMDPRSRFYEPYDPDKPPMPPDDPVSHQYMHQVNGIEGWDHWHDFGDRSEDDLENPRWREALGEYVDVNDDGEVKLSLDSALKLAYMHSPNHQSQLETLYLSAIDVTTERFRLDTQYFGTGVLNFQHNAPLAGNDSDLTVGQSPLLRMERMFATQGRFVTSIANALTWDFVGGDVYFADSLISATLTQPLLQAAGRDVGLERLTIAERALLANVRAYYQFRQGFFTSVAIGDQGVGGPRRRGGFFGATGLTGFTGQGAGGFGGVGSGSVGGGFFGGGGGGTGGGAGFAGGGAGTVGGFIGLLQQIQQIRNSQESLSQQLRTLNVLEAHLEAGVIDLTQVDQFRQSIETERATLLQSQNGLQFQLEAFKTGTLGLPPKLPVELDDSLIRQFQLVAPEATAIQDRIAAFQDTVGLIPDDPGVDAIQTAITGAEDLIDPVRLQLESTESDLTRMEEAAASREQSMTDQERRLFQTERKQAREALADLKKQFEESGTRLKALSDGLDDETKQETIRGLVVWLRGLHRQVQGSILVQARARLELISVEPIELDSDEAVQIAMANRPDYMNQRASLVDSWRLIAFNADALQSNLTIEANGSVGNAPDSAFRFHRGDSSARVTARFDAPLTRLIERNNYRQALIDYQRSRRGFIQSRDGLELGMRGLLRQIEQLRLNLEIQRRAVAIAIRRVDLTREDLNRPVPPPQPGQPPAQFGPTAATSLLTALSDLRNTQNNFMSVWLNYYAARMRLARQLGIMQLDESGFWIDQPIPTHVPETDGDDMIHVPPPVPQEWIDLAKAEGEEELATDSKGKSAPARLDEEVLAARNISYIGRPEPAMLGPYREIPRGVEPVSGNKSGRPDQAKRRSGNPEPLQPDPGLPVPVAFPLPEQRRFAPRSGLQSYTPTPNPTNQPPASTLLDTVAPVEKTPSDNGSWKAPTERRKWKATQKPAVK